MSDVLVIGYGNTLRADDAAGPQVAARIAQAGWPSVHAMAVPQLTPELAEPIAAARLVIFVDALCGARAPQVRPLLPATEFPGSPHTSHPPLLLALAQHLFGRSPRAWLVTIPARRFDLHEGLSPITASGVQACLEIIRTLVEAENRRRLLPPGPAAKACAETRQSAAKSPADSKNVELGFVKINLFKQEKITLEQIAVSPATPGIRTLPQ